MDNMQQIIHTCGKHFATLSQQETVMVKAQFAHLNAKGTIGPLDDTDTQMLVGCRTTLFDMDTLAAQKAQFLSRSIDLNDLECMSKVFFEKLSRKRCKNALAKLELDDGTNVVAGADMLMNVLDTLEKF